MVEKFHAFPRSLLQRQLPPPREIDPDNKARTFLQGDELTVERNGILSVIAAANIKQGEYIKLADGGAFQPGEKADGIGLAIESAKAGERFRATIWAL